MLTRILNKSLKSVSISSFNSFKRSFNNKLISTPPRILVTGAGGQIGTELCAFLASRYGSTNIIATGVNPRPTTFILPFHIVDVVNFNELESYIKEYKIDTIIHLASLLSGVGEKYPQRAIEINVRGIENVLELSRLYNLKLFAPSTIAVYGPTTPKVMTPNNTIMRPTTIYGVTKVYLELLGEYYNKKFGVDFRSLRYPGIISNGALPGGGTTDYAVEIYYEALKYFCYLIIFTF